MIAMLLALLALSPVEGALQDDLKISDFEADLEGWTMFQLEGGNFGEDSDSKLAITREADRVKSGKGSLSYVHGVDPGTLRVLAYARELDLAKMKSLRLQVRSSAATSVVFSLAERSGASWQCAVTVPAEKWTEIAVNLDEFVVDDPSKDDNGKLDLDAVTSFHVFDIAGFLSTLLSDLKGVRTLHLDDVRFSGASAPFTTGATPPAYIVDNFETSTVRWAPISVQFGDALKLNLYDAAVSVEPGAPQGGGKASLKFTAPRPAGKVHGMIRNLEKTDLAKAKSLDLWVKTSSDGTYLINLEEKDGSRYDHVLTLSAAEGWKRVTAAWTDFKLADDSRDENDRFDPDQVKQILVADATSLFAGAEGEDAVLRIDEVRFLLR
jgi:hypothetical protein